MLKEIFPNQTQRILKLKAAIAPEASDIILLDDSFGSISMRLFGDVLFTKTFNDSFFFYWLNS